MNRVVIASNNPGKLRELAALLEPLGIEAAPQSDFAVTEAEEPHFTFLENALAKARHAANMTGLPALADDSGLCVPALFGEPGVHSAHYAGREGCREERDARNNAKLVEQLRAAGDRSAFYYCVLVLVRECRRSDADRRRRNVARRDRARAARRQRLRLRPLLPREGQRAYRGAARRRGEEPREPPRPGARGPRGEAAGAA